MHILDTLKERGFIAQVTFEDDLYKQLERESTPFYVGFDPTADQPALRPLHPHHRHGAHAARGPQAHRPGGRWQRP